MSTCPLLMVSWGWGVTFGKLDLMKARGPAPLSQEDLGQRVIGSTMRHRFINLYAIKRHVIQAVLFASCLQQHLQSKDWSLCTATSTVEGPVSQSSVNARLRQALDSRSWRSMKSPASPGFPSSLSPTCHQTTSHLEHVSCVMTALLEGHWATNNRNPPCPLQTPTHVVGVPLAQWSCATLKRIRAEGFGEEQNAANAPAGNKTCENYMRGKAALFPLQIPLKKRLTPNPPGPHPHRHSAIWASWPGHQADQWNESWKTERRERTVTKESERHCKHISGSIKLEPIIFHFARQHWPSVSENIAAFWLRDPSDPLRRASLSSGSSTVAKGADVRNTYAPTSVGILCPQVRSISYTGA